MTPIHTPSNPTPGLNGPTQVIGSPKVAEKPTATADFNAVLRTRLAGREITFSQHAQTRLKSRGIDLSTADLDKIEQATQTAEAKGSRDSLILMNNLGLIVNIKNRTVLTAVDAQNMKDNIFTNIDSTVIVPKE